MTWWDGYTSGCDMCHVFCTFARVARVSHACLENTKFGGFGVPPKTVIFGPLFWVENDPPKSDSRGAQLYGDTRRIIYCLDTRYGPYMGVFDPKRGVLDPSRRGLENGVFGVFLTPPKTRILVTKWNVETRDSKSPVINVGIQRISWKRH
jgi:hypothetical protein